jgi:probable phosphoglycerate mutase
METLRLCLARHGETDWNAEGRIQGQLDIPLNPRGRLQAEALAGALAEVPFAAIYTSDLRRALDTAIPAAALLGLPLRARAEWRERHHGRMQGSTYAELEHRWPEGHRRLRERDPDFEVEGGESLRALSERCAQNLSALRAAHPGGMILVVTHGAVLDAVHRLVTGQALHEPRRVPIRNCALHWLRHTAAGWSIDHWGEEAHLANARDELPD